MTSKCFFVAAVRHFCISSLSRLKNVSKSATVEPFNSFTLKKDALADFD